MFPGQPNRPLPTVHNISNVSKSTTAMTVVIDIEKFQNNWTTIFMEIEKQVNLKEFSLTAPDTANIQNRTRIQETFSKMGYLKGRKQDVIDRRRNVLQSVKRTNSMWCPKIDTSNELQPDPRLTGAARKLSKGEMASLFEDILKPLDIYSILRKRRAQLESSEEMFQ